MNYEPVNKWVKIYKMGKYMFILLVFIMAAAIGVGVDSCIK